MNKTDVIALKEQLLAGAIEDHRPYRQYDGHFDDWVVARATKPIVDKYDFVWMETDEFCLLDPKSIGPREYARPGIYVLVYLANNPLGPKHKGGVHLRSACEFEVIG
jgi:hypothetical protein